MPTYFIRSDQIRGERLGLSGPLAHHLKDVLRVRPGERLQLIDETGRGHLGEVESVSRDRFEVRLVGELAPPPFSTLSVTLGQALLKGDKMDWVVQKGAELGVSRLVPLVTARSVLRTSAAKKSAQRERWQRIALEAAQQSARWSVPTVEESQPLGGFISSLPDGALRLLPWEKQPPGSGRQLFTERPAAKEVIAMVGPEGGFLDEEVSLAVRSGFLPISLGPRTLRAETAGIALLAILQHHWGDLG